MSQRLDVPSEWSRSLLAVVPHQPLRKLKVQSGDLPWVFQLSASIGRVFIGTGHPRYSRCGGLVDIATQA